jgi:leucyl/phenylalanyl-tRNA--protein transferase
MMRLPPARAPIDDGLIAYGGDFSVELLREAYSKGIFPWPQEDMPILWFSPDPRGVLDFSDFHVSTSLKKWARTHEQWSYTFNQNFSQVMEQCRLQKRPGQNGTWILPEMEKAYLELFQRGEALSLEVWEEQQLIGGIYGVLIDGIFSGESMFHLKKNASKMALWKLVEELKSRGHQWMDIQMVTPVLAGFGGKLISRNEFLTRRNL